MKRERVVVVDFGAQYGQLIARRVREAGVFAELRSFVEDPATWFDRDVRGVVLSGGPASVYGHGAPQVSETFWQLPVPILGICYGMQLMAHALGGRVEPLPGGGEYGRARLNVIAPNTPLFAGLPAEADVWMSHGDRVLEVPAGFQTMALTEETPVASMGDEARSLYAVQFHPEVVHSTIGQRVLENFLYRVCGLEASWTPGHFVDEAVTAIRRQVGEGRVVAGLSGGVDSAVAAALVHRAVGERLTAIFVDHGLLRQGEREAVEEACRNALGMRLSVVDAADRFLVRLQGVTDPEEKRKVIGREFVAVFEEEARHLGNVDFLVQGTLYPDVIESGFGSSAVIKTHHNVGGLPERMNLELVEPLRDLFKDEVRRVGLSLGLPASLVWRQPFPGPGLAVRILGEVTQEKLRILRAADHIVTTTVEEAGLAHEIWQYFAVLTGLRSVGVMGDARTYGYTVAIRAVTSDDAMTADWARLPFDVLERVSTRIVNRVPEVNRVVYDITSKPPSTIEWE